MGHFLKDKNDYMKFVEAIKNTYEVDHARCDVALDFISLVREDALLKMACYLRGFCIVYWFPYFNVLKKIDPIANRFGHIRCHMAIICFKIQQDIEELELPMKSNKSSCPF